MDVRETRARSVLAATLALVPSRFVPGISGLGVAGLDWDEEAEELAFILSSGLVPGMPRLGLAG